MNFDGNFCSVGKWERGREGRLCRRVCDQLGYWLEARVGM